MPSHQVGAEWRRWDVHIHAPGTALNDQYAGDWAGWLSAVENAAPAVTVLGVTDYLSVRSYEAVLAHKSKGRLPGIQLLFPNIEFRISPQTWRGSGINLHLLVSPDDPEHVARINEALTRLTATLSDQTISCTPEGLRRLGAAHDGTCTDPGAQYRSGVEQFKVDFSAFRSWYTTDSWLKQHCLVAVAAGQDGVSGLQREDGFHELRQEIQRFAHLIFSANPSDRQFWLEPPAASGGMPKPCVHGCDAHSVSQVLTPDHNRFCWIKGDPTFDGLRQVLHEPAERVYIGEGPPTRPDLSETLVSLTVRSDDGWLDLDALPLNRGLVAIIGEKGSGKTALADLIAQSCGVSPTPGSFLERAAEHLGNTKAVVSWHDDPGSSSDGRVNDPLGHRSSVRYLPQRFVESMTESDSMGDLVAEIEAVVFSRLSDEDKLGCSSFADLKDLRTQRLRARRTELSALVGKIGDQVHVIDDARSGQADKDKQLEALGAKIATLKAQMPASTDDGQRATLAAIEALDKEARQLSERLSALKRQEDRIRVLDDQVDSVLEEILALVAGIREELGRPIPPDTSAHIPPNVDAAELERAVGALKPILAARLVQIRQAVAELRGPSDDDATGSRTLAGIAQEREVQQATLKLSDQARQRVKALQDEIKGHETTKAALERELELLKNELIPKRAQLVQRRSEAYVAYFTTLREERELLVSLYQPLDAALDEAETSARRLEFVVRPQVRTRDWAERGSDLFDFRRTAPLCARGAIEREAADHLVQAWTELDGEGAARGIDRFVDLVKQGGNLEQQLVQGYLAKHVAQWLYSVEHITLTYGLRYEGTDLEKLSPGTKGVVLLSLYLTLDSADTRPLIIDQPDENLDNRSVFSTLVPDFRAARERRQVILITHNPNLVVNTDADQVIIANAQRRAAGLPQMTYWAGSLESQQRDPADGQTVREKVCSLLEGGRDAFERRERKYELGRQKAGEGDSVHRGASD